MDASPAAAEIESTSAPRGPAAPPRPAGPREDDGRPTTGAPRLPIDQVRELTRPSGLSTFWVIGRDYAVIAAMIWLCEAYWHPALYLLAVVVIAARVSSLGGLIHEAVHYNLFKSKRMNDWVALVFCSWPLLGAFSLRAYRKSHLTHHKYANTPLDPDPDIQGMKNIGSAREAALFFWRGLTLPVVYFAKGFWGRPTAQRVIALFSVGLFVYFLPGVAERVLLYWLIPLLTVYSLFVFIRLNAEHNAVDADEPLYRTRTVIPTLLSRLTVAPAYVGYHLAHHVYPSVPFFRRHALHEALWASSEDYRRGAHITRGYIRVVAELLAYRGGPLIRD